MIIFPNAKINLGLHITSRRSDGYHNLDTVFYPVPIYDALEIVTDGSTLPGEEPFVFTSGGLAIQGNPQENLCVKACRLVLADFPNIPPFQIHLHKHIPMGAGLGGGSADAAFTLVLLNRKFKLGLTEGRLLEYALRLGSDCPFFILNSPCSATGRGEELAPLRLDLSGWHLIVVFPGIHLPTADAFRSVRPAVPLQSAKETVQTPVENWRNSLQNDFEAGASSRYPELSRIRETLYAAGASYVSMSGSGSAMYGFFSKEAISRPLFPGHYRVFYLPHPEDIRN
jgi:4-diphosphocytidyl-2-C-methyl-D-erythritol kinase